MATRGGLLLGVAQWGFKNREKGQQIAGAWIGSESSFFPQRSGYFLRHPGTQHRAASGGQTAREISDLSENILQQWC